MKFSREWVKSTQVRKQRKYRYNAPLHLRQKMMSSHLAKDLRKIYNTRSVTIRKGDEVVVSTGSFKKQRGKVSGIDMKKLKIYVEGLKRKKASGQEVHVLIDPSNVIITKAVEDKHRFKIRKENTKQVVKKEKLKADASKPTKSDKPTKSNKPTKSDKPAKSVESKTEIKKDNKVTE